MLPVYEESFSPLSLITWNLPVISGRITTGFSLSEGASVLKFRPSLTIW